MTLTSDLEIACWPTPRQVVEWRDFRYCAWRGKHTRVIPRGRLAGNRGQLLNTHRLRIARRIVDYNTCRRSAAEWGNARDHTHTHTHTARRCADRGSIHLRIQTCNNPRRSAVMQFTRKMRQKSWEMWTQAQWLPFPVFQSCIHQNTCTSTCTSTARTPKIIN